MRLRGENRVRPTFDDDLATGIDESAFHSVSYVQDTTLSREQVADIAHEMANAHPASAFEGVQHGTTDWP